MAKFCSECGSPLPEGGVCQCQTVKTEQPQPQVWPQQPQQVQPQMQQPVIQQYSPQQPPMPPQYPPYPPQGYVQKPSEFGLYFKKFWQTFVGMIKAPVTTGVEFVKTCDIKIAFGFIGAEALAMALFVLILTAKLKLSAFTGFFVGAIFTFGMACLLPAVLLMFIKMFKGQTTYKHMLCVSGIKSLVATPFILLGFLFVLMVPMGNNIFNYLSSLGNLFYALIPLGLGGLLSYFVALKIIKGGATVKEDYTVYAVIFAVFVMAIATYIAFKIFYPMFIPKVNINDFYNWEDLF